MNPQNDWCFIERTTTYYMVFEARSQGKTGILLDSFSGLTIFTTNDRSINILLAIITYPPWRPAGRWWGRSLWRWRERQTHAEPGRSLYPRHRSPQPRQLYQQSSHRWLSWCRRSNSPCSRTSCRTYSAGERQKTLLHVMKQDVSKLLDRKRWEKVQLMAWGGI